MSYYLILLIIKSYRVGLCQISLGTLNRERELNHEKDEGSEEREEKLNGLLLLHD